jgi:hypothetical protein
METKTYTACRYCQKDLFSDKFQFCEDCARELLAQNFITSVKSEYPETLDFKKEIQCSDCKEWATGFLELDGDGQYYSNCCSARDYSQMDDKRSLDQ